MLSKVDGNEYLPPNIYYINILLVTIQDPPPTPLTITHPPTLI